MQFLSSRNWISFLTCCAGTGSALSGVSRAPKMLPWRPWKYRISKFSLGAGTHWHIVTRGRSLDARLGASLAYEPGCVSGRTCARGRAQDFKSADSIRAGAPSQFTPLMAILRIAKRVPRREAEKPEYTDATRWSRLRALRSERERARRRT